MSDLTQNNDAKNLQEDVLSKIRLKRKGNFPEKFGKRICSKASKRGLTDNAFKETEYYFEGHLRKVYPYYFTYTTFCKGRWVGKTLVDIFSEEFRAHTKEEHEKSILVGNIKVNGKVITADYVLKDNDRIENNVHRHEIAVVAAPIKIIHSCDDFVVVNKPPSVPIHPCGRYRHNSLIFILAKEHGLEELHSVHRIDRLTSGLMIFTKTIKKSQEVTEQIRERQVQKEYVCRVVGNFPDGVVCCKEPIEIISPKMGVCIVSSTGKECETVFEKLSFNGKSSVVSCKPKTGRMHQIRVHLQFLGYPIINDPIYNHADVFGPLKGKNSEMGKSREQLLEDLLRTHNLKKWLIEDNSECKDETESYNVELSQNDPENEMSLNALEYYTKSEGHEALFEKYKKEDEKFVSDTVCTLCHQKYMDPQPKDLIMFLHALKYKGKDWEFETELPAWAEENWTETSVKSEI